jgi:putative endonuclease
MGRIWEHRNKVHPTSFTAKCNCTKRVYYYSYSTIQEAIAAEKAVKAGSRQSKINLVNSINPEWRDLYEGLLDE